MLNNLKKALSVTPHYLIVMSLLFLTLFITDRFNGAMNFIAHDLTETLIIISGVVCWVQALLYAIGYHKKAKLIPFMALAMLSALIGLYLCAICTLDLVLDISRYMLRDANKFTLLAFIITSFASSVAVAASRRHEVRTAEISEVENG